MAIHSTRWLLWMVISISVHTITHGQIRTCTSTSQWFIGDGTYYGGVAGSSGGHCSLAVPAGDIYHAALNSAQYGNSSPCGTCVRILGPSGEVTVKIVDECPSCAYGDIDLALGAFPLIANPILGRVKIKWQYVNCPKDT
ncbi:MAG: RlpA-like double-psi beta-barrel domain-containing protein, partial [Cytophagales bacterium]|nr:RlpA-like double-psi beta-barrel domain-containing protein [Cytophagales bacterium]